MDQVIHGIGGTAPAALTKVPSLKMGDATIEGRTLLSADLFKDMNIPGGKGDHDAIFGADFLRELDGVISYKEARIFLKPDNADKSDLKPKSGGHRQTRRCDQAGGRAEAGRRHQARDSSSRHHTGSSRGSEDSRSRHQARTQAPERSIGAPWLVALRRAYSKSVKCAYGGCLPMPLGERHPPEWVAAPDGRKIGGYFSAAPTRSRTRPRR
jgi:hypothetical protein